MLIAYFEYLGAWVKGACRLYYIIGPGNFSSVSAAIEEYIIDQSKLPQNTDQPGSMKSFLDSEIDSRRRGPNGTHVQSECGSNATDTKFYGVHEAPNFTLLGCSGFCLSAP